MQQSGNKLSVIILSFNRLEYLKKSIQSVLSQSIPIHEVIVVDNFSPNSEKIIEYVKQIPEILLIENKENLGFSKAMNIGIQHATGDFIHLTEDDVVLEYNFLEVLMTASKRCQKLKLLSGFLFEDFPEKVLFAGGNIDLTKEVCLNLLPFNSELRDPIDCNYIPGNMVFGSHTVFEKLKGFRNDFFLYSEDVEFCIRAALLGISIQVIPTAKAHHLKPKEIGKRNLRVDFSKIINNFTVNLLYMPGNRIPIFILKSYYRSVKLLFQLKKPFFVIKIWIWITQNLPRLLLERLSIERIER